MAAMEGSGAQQGSLMAAVEGSVFASLLPASAVSGPEVAVLEFLVTNDTHSRVRAFPDPQSSSAQDQHKPLVGGIARRKTFFDARRQDNPHGVLVLDDGDLFNGSDFFQFTQGEADMKAFELLEYHAIGLGNHDFDARAPAGGEAGLARFVSTATRHAPKLGLLCANVLDAATHKPALLPYKLFQVDGITVGVTSVLGPDAWRVTPRGLRTGLECSDFISAALEAADAMAQAGAQVLVCLSHTGVNRGDEELALEGAFDVIFSGHEHFYDVPTGPVRQVAGTRRRLGLLSRGVALGIGVSRVELAVDRASGEILAHASCTTAMNQRVPEDPAVVELVDIWEKDFLHVKDEVLGRCTHLLRGPNTSGDLRGFRESPIHRVLGAVMEAEIRHFQRPGSTSPLIILNRGMFHAVCQVPQGPVTFGQVLRLLPFPNMIIELRVLGAFLRTIAAHSAMNYGQFNFLFTLGMEYAFIESSTGKTVPDPVEPCDKGSLQAVDIFVRQEALREDHWYDVLSDEYVFDTLLQDVPGRATGVQTVRRLDGVTHATLLEGFLRRHGTLPTTPGEVAATAVGHGPAVAPGSLE